MSSDDSTSPRSVWSPNRTTDKPPPMGALSSDAPLPTDGAWHALLMGRAPEEIATIIAQAGVMLQGRGSTVPAQTFQQILVIGADRVTATRWTKATLAQFKRYALEPDAMVIRYGTQETKSPVKGTHNNYHTPCRPPCPPRTRQGLGEGTLPENLPGLHRGLPPEQGGTQAGQVAGSGRKALSLKRR